MSVAMGAPQRRRPDRGGRANSDTERRALAKASERRTVRPAPVPRIGYAVLSTDGGSRGNPGPAAIGYALAAADGTVLAAHGEVIGIAGANVAGVPRAAVRSRAREQPRARSG
jgi:ribonuclease HI